MSEMERVFRQGKLNEVAQLLANPARSGIYLTRARIRAIAGEMGLRAGVQGRARMIENLFREAGSEGRAEALIARIEAEATAWLHRYGEWARACAPGKRAWREWKIKARQLRSQLRKAKKWARKMGADASTEN
ncbi:MAG: hypothetical protein O2807_13200 [bacterium]|nr:hypothetical protein [bacterium]